MKDNLYFTSQPPLRKTVLIAAWEGWSDAASAATNSLREVIAQQKGYSFAHIHYEEFYIFSELRPQVYTSSYGSRSLMWPTNKFYYIPIKAHNFDTVIFIGVEPHIMWSRYCDAIESLVSIMDVHLVLTVGALLDSVPHTRKPLITCSSLHQDLGENFKNIHYSPPYYEGPCGISSVISNRLEAKGVKTASIWAHTPHYIQSKRNPIAVAALLREIQKFLQLPLNFNQLDKDAREFENTLQNALNTEEEIADYIKELEDKFDAEEHTQSIREKDLIISQLQEFLNKRRQRKHKDEEQ